jgi:NAD(P)-dependent dehydrogenase (short-subunit alcohol dehydrogenase family)
MSGWDATRVTDQTGKTVVVTGANSGVGLEAARLLAARGASVVLGCRDPARAENARAELSRQSPGNVSTIALDLADLDSVRRCAAELREAHPTIDALVNNAGVMGGARMSTAQGFERQMGTNHLGHFLLTEQLWPAIKAAPAGRVVNVSSLASRGGKLEADMTRDTLVDPKPYRETSVYNNTKQANLLFTAELQRRIDAAGLPVRAVAVHPGVSATKLFGRQVRENRLPFIRVLGPIADGFTRVAFQSSAAGALPTVRGAVDPDIAGGSLVGPKGLGGSRGKPEILDMFKTGTDDKAAQRLWELSEEILDEPFVV